MEIRPVEPGEHAAAGRVTRAAYEEFFAGTEHASYLAMLADVAGRAGRTPVLVAVSSGAVLGTVTLELTTTVEAGSRRQLAADEAHLRMLAVLPEARRAGVGRALVEAGIVVARSAGKRRLKLSTTPAMVSAQRLYTAMGFARGPDYEMEPGTCMLSYELELTVTRGAVAGD